MTTDAAPTLTGSRVTLRRPVLPEDVGARLALGHHAEIVRAYGGSFDPLKRYTKTDAIAAVRLVEQNPLAWVIDVGGFIGQLRLHGIDRRDRRAALAVGIDDPTQLGQGYGTEAVRLALGFAFGTGLHRISLRVLADNARAIACYRRCGFVEEGRERESAFFESGWHDDLIMGCLDRDFRAL